MMPARLSAFVAVLALACGLGAHADEPVPASAVTRPAREAVVRLAVSKDGLTFTPTEDVFLRNASAPGLVRLPNGDLLAVSRAEKVGEKATPVLIASRSRDEGRSWSPPRRLTFTGPGETALVAERPGSLAIMPNGLLRFYFVARNTRDERRPDAGANADAWIGSAVTRNGCDYAIDPATRIAMKGGGDAHMAAVASDHGMQLYVTPFPAQRREADEPGRSSYAFVSLDGRRFKYRGPVQVPAGRRLGSIVRERTGWRAYGTDEHGVCSFVSDDGVRWRPEKGVRVPKAWNPAVVRLKDGTFLMLYCVAPDPRTADARELVSAEAVAVAEAAGGTASSGDAGGAEIWSAFTTESAEIAAALADGGDGTPAAANIDSDEVDALAAMAGWDGAFPPEPDYRDPVDYVTWMEANLLTPPEDNAYDHYAAFMPMPWDEPGSKPEWPGTINDMFNGDYSGPIGPWDPAEHPDWEETHVTLAWLREQFREAAQHESYAMPVNIDGKHPDEVPADERILFGMCLPSLGAHRKMVKATLADAWRVTDGQVPPDQMRGAIETSLRAANHMHQGATLIEHLVGLAEQRLVHDNARQALQHGVFSSAEDIEAALHVLDAHDPGLADPTKWLAMESTAALDAVQHFFTPASEDGQPQVNRDRLSRFLSVMQPHDEETVERIAGLSPAAVREATAAFQAYFQTLGKKMRTGYPSVRREDVGTLSEEYASTNALTQTFLPGLDRAYQCRVEMEAGRRATRLSFAAHLFKARTGRWPASLDEVPSDCGEEMRIDPFTGADFGYRLDESGPRIYTLSENGVDDGGVHSPHWNRSNVEETSSDDYVFWPPQ